MSRYTVRERSLHDENQAKVDAVSGRAEAIQSKVSVILTEASARLTALTGVDAQRVDAILRKAEERIRSGMYDGVGCKQGGRRVSGCPVCWWKKRDHDARIHRAARDRYGDGM